VALSGQSEPGTGDRRENVENIDITEASRKLFVELAEDAGDWSYMVPTDGNVVVTKEQRGNLTQLKKAGLIATQFSDGATWVLFTAKGVEYAKENGVAYIEALA
jgi:hypothetical protein